LAKALVLVSLLALLAAAAADSQFDGRDPVPISGIPLRRETGVRLVLADKPPFVLDIDAGSIKRIRGVRGPVWVAGTGSRAAIAIAQPFSRRGQVYAVRGNDGAVSRLGAGAEAASGNPTSVWVKRVVRPSQCTLRRVRLDGRITRAPRSFRCSWTIYPGGSLGFGVSRTRVIDPLTQRTVVRSPKDAHDMRLGIAAVAGKKVLLEDGPGRDLTLMDTASGTQKRFAWPSYVGQLMRGAIAVDPQGRFVALAFANPSWTSDEGAGQAFDVWIFDTETPRLTQVPDMPAFVALKRTQMAWTDDGWLVLLTQSAGQDMVALWKPGNERLQVKTLDLPSREDNGNSSFAVLAVR
jgi:hypothetical protein